MSGDAASCTITDRQMYKIEFTSGIVVRAYECAERVRTTAERLRNSYAMYYHINHDIQDITLTASTIPSWMSEVDVMH